MLVLWASKVFYYMNHMFAILVVILGRSDDQCVLCKKMNSLPKAYSVDVALCCASRVSFIVCVFVVMQMLHICLELYEP